MAGKTPDCWAVTVRVPRLKLKSQLALLREIGFTIKLIFPRRAEQFIVIARKDRQPHR